MNYKDWYEGKGHHEGLRALRDAGLVLNKAHLSGAVAQPTFLWKFIERLENQFGSPASAEPAPPNTWMRTAAEAARALKKAAAEERRQREEEERRRHEEAAAAQRAAAEAELASSAEAGDAAALAAALAAAAAAVGRPGRRRRRSERLRWCSSRRSSPRPSRRGCA